MEDGVKIAAIVSGALVVIAFGMFATCNHQADIDAKSPVVESCIKHPATVPPFRQGNR